MPHFSRDFERRNPHGDFPFKAAISATYQPCSAFRRAAFCNLSSFWPIACSARPASSRALFWSSSSLRNPLAFGTAASAVFLESRLLHGVLYASFASIVISALKSLETGQPSFAFFATS
jgi:hypothetical protein